MEYALRLERISNQSELREFITVAAAWRKAADVETGRVYATAYDIAKDIRLTENMALPLTAAFHYIQSHRDNGLRHSQALTAVTCTAAFSFATGMANTLGLFMAAGYAAVTARSLNADLKSGQSFALMDEAQALHRLGYGCRRTWPQGGQLIRHR